MKPSLNSGKTDYRHSAVLVVVVVIIVVVVVAVLSSGGWRKIKLIIKLTTLFHVYSYACVSIQLNCSRNPALAGACQKQKKWRVCR